MLNRINRKAAVQAVVVLAAAYALKYFYSTASANVLRWILWPTTRLTELVTGSRFAFESYAGYMSDDRSFVIAAPCAGVNFLIAAFLMLMLRRLWISRSAGVAWRFYPLAAVVAFCLTIIANTARISTALWLNSSHATIAGLDRDEIHRLDGILVYFAFLLLLYVINEAVVTRREVRPRTFLIPLAVYYAMTLAVPVLNGALRRGSDFWHHAVFVIAAPIALISIAAAIAELTAIYLQRKRIAAAAAFLPGDAAADEVCTRTNVSDPAAFSHRTIGLKHGAIVVDR